MSSSIIDSSTDSTALAKARSILQEFFKDDLPKRTGLNVGSLNSYTAEARSILQDFFLDDLPPDANPADVLTEIRLRLQDKLRSLTHERDDTQRLLSQAQEQGIEMQRRLAHEDDLRKTRQVTDRLLEKNKTAVEEQLVRLQKRLANCRCHLRAPREQKS